MRSRLSSLLGLALFTSVPLSGFAQPVTASAADLSTRLKPGETVYVTESTQPVKGKLIDASISSLVLSIDGRRQDFNLANVTRVERQRRATKKGALIGLVAAWTTVATTVYVLNERNCGPVNGTIRSCDDEFPLPTILFVMGGVGGAMGAAAGAGIGALITRRETVFASAPATAVRLTLAPVVHRGRKGVTVSIEF